MLGIGHSMGGHLLAESIRECALTCPYKLVFAAADQRQQSSTHAYHKYGNVAKMRLKGLQGFRHT